MSWWGSSYDIIVSKKKLNSSLCKPKLLNHSYCIREGVPGSTGQIGKSVFHLWPPLLPAFIDPTYLNIYSYWHGPAISSYSPTAESWS